MATYSEILNKKAKEWGAPDMMSRAKQSLPKIPFSAPMLNWATYGGVPRQRITEFYGFPNGGKSTTAINVAYNAMLLFKQEFETQVQFYREQIANKKKEYEGPLEDLLAQGPKRVLYADIEHTFDWKWAAKMGLLEGDIDVMEPPDVPAEQLLQTIQDIVCTGEVGLIIVDSVPTLTTAAELDKKYGERTVASLAGLMTIFMRKIVPLLARYDCTLLLINQERVNMDNPYADQTPGGEAIKFYSTLRMKFKLGAPVDIVGNELPMSTENPAGYLINVKIVKQKGAAFDRKNASYFLMTQSGIRPDFDYAKLAIQRYDIIHKQGGWFTFLDPYTKQPLECEGKTVKVNGQIRVYEYLNSHSEYYEVMKKFIMDDINGQEPQFDESAETENNDIVGAFEEYDPEANAQ